MTAPSLPANHTTARGSLLAGTGLGLAVLLGGYYLLWLLFPNLHAYATFVTYLVLPWLGLGSLAVFLVRDGRPRTALGLGLAGLILLGIAALLFGALALMLANSNGWH